MKKIIIFFLLVWSVASCSVTKNLHEGQYLLMSNKIDIIYGDSVSRKMRLDRGSMFSLISPTQTPNSRFLGVNIAAWIYNQADSSNTWWNRTLRRMGRAPVLYDSLETGKINRNILLYMHSMGYYNALVRDSVYFTKDTKASVVYSIDAGNPYRIGDYKYHFEDSVVMPFVLAVSKGSVLRSGELLSRSLLEKERNRITSVLKNDGFFGFSVNSVNYLIDTATYDALVTININKRLQDRKLFNHIQYKINEVLVRPTSRSFPFMNDSLQVVDTLLMNGVSYLYPETIKGVKPKRLSRLIALKPGEMFMLEDVDKTKNKLNALGFYRSVNLIFTDVDVTKPQIDNNDKRLDNLYGKLDCEIVLSQELKQGFKVEAEVSTTTYFTGFSVTLGYSNKNLFRGAEVLSISATGGYDFMNDTRINDSWEIGGAASITFPRLLAPIKLSRFSELNRISTIVEASINSQKRPYYDRTISTVTFGYSWNNGSKFSYLYRPISVSFLYVPRVQPSYLESITNPYLRKSYESQLIAGANYSLGYQNKVGGNNYNVRANFESSGNLLYLGSYVFAARQNRQLIENTDITEDFYKIFSVRYAQYVRADVSFNYEYKFNKKFALAYRLYSGYGHAYGNSNALPFERMFFCGGGNSMRGWQVRTLGPGDTPQQPKLGEDGKILYPKQIGNIKLETNLEARFAIYKLLYGAMFFDLGNIWANGKGETNEQGKFKLNTFYKQLGFNTGLGLRLDFNFFVVRMDWGVKLHNPGLAKGHRWIKKFNLSDTALHFAIGYPF